MLRTVTLRLDQDVYQLFHAWALADNRSLSNLIETSAKKHLEECLFADETEMRDIREDRRLVQKLRQGSRAAKTRQGRFVD